MHPLGFGRWSLLKPAPDCAPLTCQRGDTDSPSSIWNAISSRGVPQQDSHHIQTHFRSYNHDGRHHRLGINKKGTWHMADTGLRANKKCQAEVEQGQMWTGCKITNIHRRCGVWGRGLSSPEKNISNSQYGETSMQRLCEAFLKDGDLPGKVYP